MTTYPGSSTYPGSATFPSPAVVSPTDPVPPPIDAQPSTPSPPFPPAPTGKGATTGVPVPPRQPAPTMAVSIYQRDYQRLGQIADYISCSVTWQWLGSGTGELVIGEDHPLADDLLQADTQVLPVVVTVNGVRWSGRVDTVTLERDGPPGTGTLNVALVDDSIWLTRMLASQNGSNPALTGMPAYDTRTGPVASVAADFINAAATRLGVPVRAVKPAVDTSAQATLAARMTTLADLVLGPLKDAGVTMDAKIWLPGDPQPGGGAALTLPTVIFNPRFLADKPWLQWSDSMSGISKMTFQTTQPKAYRTVIGLAGDLTARVFDSRIDTAARLAMGLMGLPEIFTDATDATLGTASQDAGRKALAAEAGTVTATFAIADANPWVFGKDYVVGDMATFAVGGTSWRQRVTKVTADDGRADGLVLTPVIGEDAPIASSEAIMIRALAKLAASLRSLQAGR